MKVLRGIGLVLGGVVALLALGAAVLYLLFDGDQVKAQLSRSMLESRQRTLVIEGQPKLSVWPDIGVQLGHVTLSEHASQDEFVALESARVSVALVPLLSRQVQVRALELNGLKATLVKKKNGGFNFSDLMGQPVQPSTNAPAATPAAPLQLDVAGIRVTNAQVTWRDEQTGNTTVVSNLGLRTGRVQADTASERLSVQALSLLAKGVRGPDAFELQLDTPRLDLSPQKSSGDTLSLVATLAGGNRRAQVEATLAGLEGNADALNIGNLALKLQAQSGDTTLKGQLSSPVAVNVAAQTLALGQLAGRLEVASPQMPMKHISVPVSGSLRVNAAQQSAALDLLTQLDASRIAVKLAVTQFAPLALAFDLEVNQLNVDRYLPPKAPAAADAKQGQGAKKESVLDFSALKGPNVRGAVRIGAVQVSGIQVEQLNATLQLSGGRLEIAPLSMQLYQGRATGRAEVNAQGNSVALQQTLTGVNINPLMKDMVHKDLLEGRGNLVLDLRSHGDTVGAMKKALAGTAALNLQDGAIKGINLAQSLRDLQRTLGGKATDSTQQAKAGEKTDFSELSAAFRIANGVAHNDDLAMKSPFLRLAGAGDVDIGTGQMNYLAKASVVGSSEGQGGKNTDQLKGLTVPVRVMGPFENLTYRLEFSNMVEDLLKSRVEEKKQEIQTQMQDKVRDLLKGVLGR